MPRSTASHASAERWRKVGRWVMPPDCGDNGCYFAKDKGGMRTNGGCRCLSNAGFSKGVHASVREMLLEVLKNRQEIADLKEQLARFST